MAYRGPLSGLLLILLLYLVILVCGLSLFVLSHPAALPSVPLRTSGPTLNPLATK